MKEETPQSNMEPDNYEIIESNIKTSICDGKNICNMEHKKEETNPFLEAYKIQEQTIDRLEERIKEKEEGHDRLLRILHTYEKDIERLNLKVKEAWEKGFIEGQWYEYQG